MSHTTQNAQNANLCPHAAAALSSLHVDVAELCEAQDAATMQILAMATLARAALDGDMEDAADHVGHALDAIIRIAAEASAGLDAAQIEIGDSRVRDAAATYSPFGHVTSP